ncbi:hypothetical protein EJ04DRAFT_437892 [Polyplosphaeria fusca]|uniref:YAG7-like dimerisation domain-containing protein n=1 Tax=Polyplosphaeria fusca TaxID=682080 RepID=A0A9P4QZE1_9PLEO|nr:hypothetical protein EJ04DRAFT_437892 [Polyplosphaeria fusca]
MATDVVANPQSLAAGESKSARKKKAKGGAAATAVPAPERPSSELDAGSSDPAGKVNGAEGSSDNAYIRELQKNVRNTTKKLNAYQKVDAIIDAHPGVSLEELVATRKINADQKAQIEKKPALQAQLVQFEEQLTQYKKFDQEYQHKAAQEKELLQQSHSSELEKLRDTVKAEAALEFKKAFKEKFLTLSRFLRAAAARRQLDDDESDLTKAFEGALLLVYGGDAGAVAAAEKLIDGTEDSVPSTEGVPLSVTCTLYLPLPTDHYSQVKQAALEDAPFAAEEAWAEDVAQAHQDPLEAEITTAITTDPTVVNAGLTEINTGFATLDVNGTADASGAPPATSVDAGAANAAAEEQWDKQQSGSDDPLAESFEMVPRDPAETESPAAVAPISSTQSWADDAAETAAAAASTGTLAPANDGFTDVHHNRGRGRGPGGPRGGRGGPRGEYRGRGGRGGRGGGFRGDRGRGGGFRGARGDSQ